MINEKTKGEAFPEIAIESLNLYKALGYVGEEEYGKLQEYIKNAIDHLVSGGAEIVALTAATMHVIYEELKKEVPVISIPEAVSAVAVRKGYKKIGLLGTIFTMEKDFLKKSFVEKEIEVITPSKEEMMLVNERISKELEYGIEAIILGCTELPLALNQENSPVECLDIMRIHIDTLVECMMR